MTIERAISSFLSRSSVPGATGWGARDECRAESLAFLRTLDICKVPGGELINGVKFKDSVILSGHYAVQVGDLVYDWTARQFDEDAPLPKITTVAEFRAEWMSFEDFRAQATEPDKAQLADILESLLP